MQIAFFCVWQFHYAYRAFVYPLFTSHSKRTPLLMILSGVCFQVINTLFQTFWIFNLGAANYPDSYLISFPCIAGIFLFITGTVINRHSDFILRGLRKNGDYSYKIPRGGLFFLVSCPNYLGEILIWLGWAIMLNAPAGFCFFAWTVANLLPRAISSHLWYREHFQDYPPGRKALIPFLL